MKKLLLLIALMLCVASGVAFADDAAAEKEKPKQQEDKPRPDSVLSSVLELPVIKGWGVWMASKNDGAALTAWGESIRTIDGYQCWGVAVGKTLNDKTITWKHFCVTPGGKIWVEGIPDPKTDEITYFTYDEWVGKCKPTDDSPGNC